MKNIILRWAHGFKKEIPEQINSISNTFQRNFKQLGYYLWHHTKKNTVWENTRTKGKAYLTLSLIFGFEKCWKNLN